jgi:type IV pilus assembly protein PilX
MSMTGQFASRCRQAGLSLLVVLIALVIIGFAAIALLRSSDIGTLIVGNLGFQKTALASGDAGTEVAANYLVANSGGNLLFNDIAADAYYATTADACDLTGTRTPDVPEDDVNWTGTDPGALCNMDAIVATPAAGIAPGFEVRYVINRVCNGPGDPNSLVVAGTLTPMACSRLGAGASEGSTRGGVSYGNLPLTGQAQTYYRITTRIDGPRNTVRYVQVLVVI